MIVANIEKGYDQTTLASKIFELSDKYSGPEKTYLAGDPIQQEEIDKEISEHFYHWHYC